MKQRIFRASKEQGKTNGYTLVDNSLCIDKRLSDKTHRIHCYILTKPDDWEVNIQELINTGLFGKRTAVMGAVSELVKVGYWRSLQKRRVRGQFPQNCYLVRETTDVAWPDKLDIQDRNRKTGHGEPQTVNPPLLITECNKTESTNPLTPKGEFFSAGEELKQKFKDKYPRPAFNKSTIDAIDKAWPKALATGDDPNEIIAALDRKLILTPEISYWGSPVNFLLPHGRGEGAKGADWKCVGALPKKEGFKLGAYGTTIYD